MKRPHADGQPAGAAGRQKRVGRLLGPNGAGKSTTIDVLLGLTRPDAGRVTLFGGPPRAAVKAVSAHTAGAKAAVPGHKQSSRSSDLRMNWTTVDSDALNPAFA